MPRKSGKNEHWSDVFENPTRVANQALLLARYFRKWETARRTEMYLVSLTIYPPEGRRVKWLVIAKRGLVGIREVAFYQAAAPFTAILGMFNAIATDTAGWKSDPYDARSERNAD